MFYFQVKKGTYFDWKELYILVYYGRRSLLCLPHGWDSRGLPLHQRQGSSSHGPAESGPQNPLPPLHLLPRSDRCAHACMQARTYTLIPFHLLGESTLKTANVISLPVVFSCERFLFFIVFIVNWFQLLYQLSTPLFETITQRKTVKQQ